MPPVLDTTKLALIYPRQSSERQVEHNIFSLENQLKLKELAIADGFPEERVMVIEDDLGKSARTIANRVGMSRALRMVDQGLVGALYAEDQTRLSRDVDTVDHMEIGKCCRIAKVPIWYGGSWRDLNDRNDRLVYKVEAVIGSEMWAAHVEKMYKAQRAKAEKGQAAAKLPRGYRPNRDVPRKDPSYDRPLVYEPEAEVIRAFVAKVLEIGSARGAFYQIGPLYWPDGSRITLFTLWKCLTHPTYRGCYTWGTTRVEDSHEAIITREQARQIDQMRDLNRKTLRRKASSGNVLAGLVWCPECNRKMNSAKAGRSRYKCMLTYLRAQPDLHFSVTAHDLDDLVVKDLFLRLSQGLVDRILKHFDEIRAVQAKVIDVGEASRQAVQRRIDGLTRALGDPSLAPAAMKVLIQQLNQATEELEAIDAAKKAHAAPEVDMLFYRELRHDPDLIAMIPYSWDDQPIHWRRSWIRRFVQRVDVTRDGGNRYLATVTYLDGQFSRLVFRGKAPMTTEEIERVEELMGDRDFPGETFAGARWIARRLADDGFSRSPQTIQRFFGRHTAS